MQKQIQQLSVSDTEYEAGFQPQKLLELVAKHSSTVQKCIMLYGDAEAVMLYMKLVLLQVQTHGESGHLFNDALKLNCAITNGLLPI